MRLPRPFYRLPVRFDAARLREEVAALPPDAWAAHPGKIPGNSSVRLISVAGMESDEVIGVMLPTQHLQRCAYVRQILTSFGVVWSRSRFMRLAPRAGVPEHADINHHWFNRVRLHIPVITRPEVRFHCGAESVHMAAGEAWLFDNWRLHRVENPCDAERIHLVADTTGTSAFWQFVARADSPEMTVREFGFDPARNVMPMTERTPPPPIMSPADVELQVMDLRGELTPQVNTPDAQARVAHYHGLLDGFCRDWRQVYLLHGPQRSGWAEYVRLRDTVRAASRQLAEGLATRTNGVNIHLVLEARLLQHVFTIPEADLPASASSTASAGKGGRAGGTASAQVTATSAATATPTATATATARATRAAAATQAAPVLARPIFIVAAPRSGSTLLFETLAASSSLHTLGGEAHWLIERLPALRPGAPGVESNRLTATHATAEIAAQIVSGALDQLRDSQGQPPAGDQVRLLEKTPKNALRIPFLNAIFPDAGFVFLWRDPRENVSSIIEAWRSGNWVTYRELPGWEGSWSMLLPPGWQRLQGKPIEEIAAYQWDTANRMVLEDLSALPRERWCSLGYHELLADPAATIGRICGHASIEFDSRLATRVASPLPLSRYTHTAPEPEKWKRNEELVLRVLPRLDATWQRLKALRD